MVDQRKGYGMSSSFGYLPHDIQMVDQRKGYGMSSVFVTYLMTYRWLTKGRDTECLQFWLLTS